MKTNRTQYIEAVDYVQNQKNYMHDEDGALEFAESEIRRLNIRIAELEATNTRLINKLKEIKNDK